MDKYLIVLLQKYLEVRNKAQRYLISPRFQKLSNTIALITVLKLGWNILSKIRELGFGEIFFVAFRYIKVNTFTFLKSLPIIHDKVEIEIGKQIHSIEESLLGNEEERNKYRKFVQLPKAGLSEDEIYNELEMYKKMSRHSYKDGKTSGAVYNADDKLSEIIVNAMAKYQWANPLHPGVFPGVRKMEAEVVAMVIDMFHGTNIGACGTTTSGGTESILLTCRAHKEWARAEKGITSPHMIIPVTAHAAFDKAADYFGIRVTHAPVDPKTYKVDINKVKKAICSNTIMLVGSCPGFPHGVQDDIGALSKLAIKYKIGLHVDCCLGGFIVPFMEEAGYATEPFDFRVPGVTSISADTHKYGCAPKGSSVILYRSPDIRRYQFFSITTWPGGVYASPTIAGSRPGNIIVGCWVSMIYIGREGYVSYCKQIIEKTMKMKNAIKSHPELYIFGDPVGSVVAFGSNQVDPYRIGGMLNEKGWDISWIQYPNGIHLSVTNLINEKEFIKDLDDIMEQIRQEPHAPLSSAAKAYGTSTTIPDRSLIDRIARGFIDTMYKTI